ncbi:MAG: carboxypeptidase-like regulatory domain-containing protein [Acidobacteria bacterium]|nr:carboxypeptidase-like regulatory domain-containing protein [Acidobacteriota bacterium]
MRLLLSTASFVLLLAASAAAQTSSTANQAKRATVEGTVVNAQTKEPLRRAEVSLLSNGAGRGGGGGFGRPGGPGGGGGGRKVTTDAAGKFSFTDVEAGQYTVAAQRNGFLNGRYGAKRPNQPATPVKVSDGDSLRSLTIELLPQAVIAGRIFDDEGEPLQGAFVMLVSGGPGQRGGRGGPQRSTATNDRGEFRLINVSPGDVILQVSPTQQFGPGGPNLPENADSSMVTTYFPGVTELSRAQKIPVTAGAELTGFDIRLQKTRVYTIRGRLIDSATGQPPNGAGVLLMPRDAAFTGMAIGSNGGRQTEGRFELRGVPAGSYNLMVRGGGGPGGGRGGSAHRERLDVTGNIDNLTIRVLPPLNLTGQVIARDPEKSDVKNVRVTLTDVEGVMNAGSRGATKPDGSFAIDGVAAGRYRITATPGSGGYIESIRYGEMEVLGQEVEIAAGSSAPIRVTMNHEVASLNVTVTRDESATQGATVVLFPADKSRWSDQGAVRTAAADRSAAVALSNLAPGNYLLLAVEEFDFGFWEDPEVMRKIEGRLEKVTLDKNAAQSVSLKLTPLGN